MAKNWGEISEGGFSNFTSKNNKVDSESFFDKVDTTGGELSAIGGSLQKMIANSQQAAATQAATASVGLGMGSSSSESESEDEN